MFWTKNKTLDILPHPAFKKSGHSRTLPKTNETSKTDSKKHFFKRFPFLNIDNQICLIPVSVRKLDICFLFTRKRTRPDVLQGLRNMFPSKLKSCLVETPEFWYFMARKKKINSALICWSNALKENNNTLILKVIVIEKLKAFSKERKIQYRQDVPLSSEKEPRWHQKTFSSKEFSF